MDLQLCPRILIGGLARGGRPVVTAEEIGVVRGGGGDNPVIRLSLRKPRGWGWKLTTAASAPALVCLVDDNGNVLHDDRNNVNRLAQQVKATPLDLSRHWNESSESEGSATGRRRHRRKNDSGYKSLRRKKGGKENSSAPGRGGEADDLDIGYASLRRDKESGSGYASPKNNNDLDIGYASLRRQSKESGSGYATPKNSNDLDIGYASLRRQSKESGSGYASPKNSNDLDVGYASLRRQSKESCSGYASPKNSNNLDIGYASLRRRDKESGSGYASLRRGSKSTARGDYGYALSRRTTESPTESVPSSSGKHRRDNTSGPSRHVRLTPATSHVDVPPRRPRRRSRPAVSAMGSNVSRQGLSGRRTQSSGNLCNGNKILARDVGRILASCSSSNSAAHNKGFCGSLPNYLDGGGNELDDRCNNNNNNNNVVASSSMKARLEEQKRGLELRLVPQQDLALQDQGYASERSPEDEHPPPLPPPDLGLGAERLPFWCLTQHYPFITPDALFEVTLLKSNRGLGLSVTGGVETSEQWPGLIRIKRLFPHQPAWQSGQLASGDIVLAVNGTPLTGLTNYQALEVLRTSPSHVVLEMCRPPSDVFCAVAPSEPPPPPRRDGSYRLSSSQVVAPLPLLQIEEPCGEFDIILQKVNRSLGFTLRKEDESVLGHYVRALVREPALSDGRIRPGDKIVEVNDVPLSPMSHEEAVTFLRQCGETVKLRLYRDAAQTPVAALSPSDPDPPGCMRPRPALRQEARDMLTDLAVRKLSPSESGSSAHGLLQCLSGGSTPGASPRRRRLTKTPSPDITTVAKEKLGERYLVSSHLEDSANSQESPAIYYVEGTDLTDLREDSNPTLPQRPQFLDLEGDSPQASRKPKYTFAVPEIIRHDYDQCDGYPTSGAEPTSLPPLSSTSSTSTAFSYRNPAYHSANPKRSTEEEEATTECMSDQDISAKVFDEQAGRTCSLLKWKGVVFTPGTTDSRVLGENEQILTVELNRGWNSRLGFSLQAHGCRTYVSAIYADSVAARDGRLRAQDQLLTVNDENVESMTTAEIIDLLRKIRGTIEIRVLRQSGPNRQPS